MLTEQFLDFFGTLFQGIVEGLIAYVPPPPGWFLTGCSYLNDLTDFLQSFDTWIPVSLTLTIVGAVVAAFLLAQMLGLMRVIVSYLTFGGGAT